MKLSRVIFFGFIFAVLTAQSDILKTNPCLNLVDKIEINLKSISESVENINNNPASVNALNTELIYEEVKKEKCTDEIVNTLSEFLQKYIASDDVQFEKKLALIHKMLTQTFEMKKSAEMQKVEEFRASFKEFKKISQPKYKNRFYRARVKDKL